MSLFLTAGVANAALQGSATVNPTQLTATTWRYDVSISNTGTTPIGTLWFAWIPGQNYLTSQPTSIQSAAGWTPAAIGSGSAWSVRWTAQNTSVDINAGGSLGGFSFVSSMTPTAISGNSPVFTTTPVTTSFFYEAAAFGDPGFRFVASVIPTPGAAGVLAAGMLLAGRRRR
ncbi:MAG: hypothetical protein K2X32_08875 [Phycisphaerales bacterium]|nr:hypothetical protein [Phycisphaerales bacterium]